MNGLSLKGGCLPLGDGQMFHTGLDATVVLAIPPPTLLIWILIFSLPLHKAASQTSPFLWGWLAALLVFPPLGQHLP